MPRPTQTTSHADTRRNISTPPSIGAFILLTRDTRHLADAIVTDQALCTGLWNAQIIDAIITDYQLTRRCAYR